MNNLLKQLGDKVILLILFLSFLFAGLYSGIPILPLLSLLWLQYSFIFIPGFLINKFFNLTYKDNISFIYTSYAIGFALSIVLYTILSLINFQNYIAYLVYPISFISFAIYILKGYYKNNIISHSLKINIIFFILMIILGFTVYQYTGQSAEIIGYQNLGSDNIFWFKNCVAVTKGYPYPDLSVAGFNVRWHVFSCFPVALMHLCTNIEIYDLCFYSSYIWQLFLFLGGTYVISNELLSSKKMVFYFCLILFFCSSFEPFTNVFYTEHIYGCKLGCTDGQAFSMFTIFFFSRFYNKKIYVLLSFLFFYCTIGAKSTNGVIVLMIIGIYLFINIIKRKNILMSIITGIIFLFVFLFVANLFILDSVPLVSGTSNAKMSLSLVTVLRNPLGMYIYTNLLPYLGKIISYIITFFLYIPLIHFIIIPISFFSIYLYQKRRIRVSNLEVSFMIGGILAICMYLFINHFGLSQMYFSFAAFPFILLFSFIIIEITNINDSIIFNRIMISFVLISLLSSLFLLPKTFDVRGLHKKTFDIICSVNGYDITKLDVEGLKWVRDNLPQHALLITNKILKEKDVTAKRSFITSAFSEKQVYLEGWDFTNIPEKKIVVNRFSLVKQYFNGEKDARNSLKEKGVTHSVLFKGFTNTNDNLGKKIFENKSIVIYEL